MRKATIVLIAGLSIFLLSFGILWAAQDEQRDDALYFCSCGAQCKCDSVSTHPGTCKCNKPMQMGHVLKIEGDEAIVCTCGEGCTCKIDANDPTKCGCGNPVKRISLKGTGLYVCGCGASCQCNTVSDKPGKCKCGNDLKKID